MNHRHKRILGLTPVIVTVLAVSLFVAAPFLIEHHHHSDLLENIHCAVCLFASAHVTPATSSIDVAPALATVTFPCPGDEIFVASPHAHRCNQRAPPVA